jgi:phosphoribosylaminoimidazole-succinocarboxamide synthase
MITQIREYIASLSIINQFAQINVDFLGEKPTEYVIEPIPISQVLRNYTDGSTLNQYVFQFGSLEYYGSDVIENMQNSTFYETLTNCIQNNNRLGILPSIEGIQSIEVLNIGTIQNTTTDSAKYAIQMRITYFKNYIQGGCSI